MFCVKSQTKIEILFCLKVIIIKNSVVIDNSEKLGNKFMHYRNHRNFMGFSLGSESSV